MEFQDTVSAAGAAFREKNYQRVVIVGDYDTDGLASVALFSQACAQAGIAYSQVIIPQLDALTLADLDEHEGDALVFLDVGSTNLDILATASRDVYVLDHHEPKGQAEAVVHMNPLLFGIESSSAIASAGVAYWFALGMDKENKHLAPLALLGALGDTQERQGFSQLNKTILQHAVVQGSVKQSERLRLFGLHTRPITKVLTYSTDLKIPGVTNNFHGAKKFLQSLNIRWSVDGKARKYVDLTEEEQADLHDAILARKPDATDEELYVPVFIWLTMPEALSDMKELATMINACGRLGEYPVAFDALAGKKEAQKELLSVLSRYKQVLQSTFSNLESMQADNEEMFQGKKYVLFDLDDKLPPSMAGIIASMLARNDKYPSGTIVGVITTFARDREKLSLRASKDVVDVRLQDMLAELFTDNDISTGGHANAAGAVFPAVKHDMVVEKLLSALK
jgi:RecJ-like exonuclease